MNKNRLTLEERFAAIDRGYAEGVKARKYIEAGLPIPDHLQPKPSMVPPLTEEEQCALIPPESIDPQIIDPKSEFEKRSAKVRADFAKCNSLKRFTAKMAKNDKLHYYYDDHHHSWGTGYAIVRSGTAIAACYGDDDDLHECEPSPMAKLSGYAVDPAEEYGMHYECALAGPEGLKEFRKFLKKLQFGDELHWYSTMRGLSGGAGPVITRNGKVVAQRTEWIA